MEAPKHIPVSQKVPELTTQTATHASASRKAQGGRPLLLRVATRPYHLLQENTFAPNFLSGAWATPALGYLVAFVFQLVMSIAILALIHFYPTFRFPSVPLILVILLVALGWGAGPSIVALLIGAGTLLIFVLPPTFSLSIAQSEDIVGIGLYVVVGLTISIFASNNERARRTSEQLRLRLDSIIDAIPDSLTIYDAEGRRVQQNRVAREIDSEANPPLTLAQIVSQLATRRSSGELLPLEELPLARALRGEIVTGAEMLYRVPIKQKDRLVAVSAAPLYSPSGKTIEGAVSITHDLSERKQIEDELRESEERYRTIVQTANEGVWLIDTEARTLYANEVMAKMLGVSAEQMIGHSLLEFVFPADEAEGQVRIENNLRGRFEQFDFRFRCKDGNPLHTLACTSPIRNGAGNIVGALGMFTDVTERRRTEEQERILVEVSKVLTSTLDYRETLANIASLIVPQLADWFAVDLVDAEGHYELIEIDHKDPEQVKWARALREQYPVDPDAPTGAPNVVRTGQSELYAEITDEMLVASAKNEEELALARQIGYTSLMLVPLVARGKTIGVVTFVSTESGRKYDRRDMTLAEEVGRRAGVAIDNARLYQEAQKARDQLNIILQGVVDGISVQDGDGRLIFMNEAGAKRSGYLSAEDALHTADGHILRALAEQRFEMLDEHSNPLPYEELPGKRALRGEKAPQAIVQYYDKVTQTRQWSLVKARPLINAAGRVELAITIFSDVTESYEEKQRKDEFISMASHELKTPVTSLKGFAQVLQRRLQKQGDEQGLHYIARMDAQLSRLTKLVGDLLDVSKMLAGKLTFDIEPFELDELVLETVENVQAATPSHQVLVEGRTGGCILGDKDRLGQVFINLLTNAVKYSPKAEKVVVHLSADRQEAIVSVQDFGIGVDAVHHQKIFERFYQVTNPEERTFPGLGMGLYISSEIVERHDGRVWIESRKGEGSTFSVALPLAQKVS